MSVYPPGAAYGILGMFTQDSGISEQLCHLLLGRSTSICPLVFGANLNMGHFSRWVVDAFSGVLNVVKSREALSSLCPLLECLSL